MKTVLFTGPTLTALAAREVLEAECYAPAAQGDVYRAATGRPFAIGIIDGYFDSVPAVWHKEILWAMSEGIHVFGSASMGALRAAEMDSFGMVGVGEIYEAYRDGVLEDDDEVAVTHGSAEFHYRATSDAMVNIRATLAKARSQDILDQESQAALERIAKNLFYPERTYIRMLELAASAGVSDERIAALRSWLPANAVNRKREDALAMLLAMKRLLESNPGPKAVSYYFEETLAWEAAKMAATEVRNAARSEADEAVLQALGNDPQAAARAEAAALGWWLTAERARSREYVTDAPTLLEESSAFCKARQLAGAADVDGWLARNHCRREDLERILGWRASTREVRATEPQRLEQVLLDYLRWTGEYEVLLRDARPVRQS